MLITGESGTGKELVARALHENSSRHAGPFIKINCAAIPKTLMESELFGYEKGAFTGAVGAKPGRFELADGGTLFLDEIGEIPVEMQVKLLRVLQETEFERVGGIKTIKVDVRLVTATNRDLKQEIAAGSFREDLFYRLNVVPIHLPPLRERREDIPLLVEHFIAKFNERLKKQIAAIVPEALERLVVVRLAGQHPRARERDRADDAVLRGAGDPAVGSAVGGHGGSGRARGGAVAVARGASGRRGRQRGRAGVVARDGGRRGGAAGAQLAQGSGPRRDRTCRARADSEALDETGGNVTQAARKLKISRKSLQTKMKELGLRTER